MKPEDLKRHGTTYGYHIGCRCEECRKAEHEGYLRRRAAKGIPKFVPPPPRVIELSSVEAAYLSGFFDGEGTIGIYGILGKNQRSRYLHLKIGVGGTNESSINRFLELFGGSITLDRDRARIGRAPLWKWSATGRNAQAALNAMFTYLKVKRPEAIEALRVPMSDTGNRTTEENRQLKIELSNRIRSLKGTAAWGKPYDSVV